ncbi:MAG: GntR family transcriptional regulator [Pseudomonadota bacterium]
MGLRRTAHLLDEIEDLILTGTLAPGDRLDEMSLASQFGVSRTPVREAIRTLAATGLIDHRPNRGAVVRAVGPTERAEMFEVMATLEAFCAERAARAGDPAKLPVIAEAHRRCGTAARDGDGDAYYYCNEIFHEAIDAASCNGFLSEHVRALRRRLKPYRRLQLRAPGRLMASLAEHGRIVDAIVAGDAAAASQAMYDHVAVQGARFADVAGLAG